jgi:hypothetical protein
MKHIHILVKFERRLSIPVLRKKSFFTKKKKALGKRFVSIFSPELNGLPVFKFDKDMDVSCVYCMIQRNMHLDVERVRERYQTGPAQAYFKCRPQIHPVLYVWSSVEHFPFFQ